MCFYECVLKHHNYSLSASSLKENSFLWFSSLNMLRSHLIDALVFGHLQFNLYMYICVQRFRPMTALFSKNQGAFALGRSIIDNIIIAHEIFVHFQRN